MKTVHLTSIFNLIHIKLCHSVYLIHTKNIAINVCSLFLLYNVYTQHGADIDRRNRDNLTALDLVKEQEGDLADLLRGDSALLDAAKKGDLDRIKKLLTPENINCRDEEGRNSTLLHLSGGPLYHIHNVSVGVGDMLQYALKTPFCHC